MEELQQGYSEFDESIRMTKQERALLLRAYLRHLLSHVMLSAAISAATTTTLFFAYLLLFGNPA